MSAGHCLHVSVISQLYLLAQQGYKGDCGQMQLSPLVLGELTSVGWKELSAGAETF